MKGDFTRWTFRPEEHYHGVLKQQGRVDLDADWNEQGAIVSHRVETETLDVVGPCGAPVGDPGFILTPSPDGSTLMVRHGRAYIDGILCENEADIAIDQQPYLPGFKLPTQPGVYVALLRVWLRHITFLDDAEIREVALGGPDTCTRAQTIWQAGVVPLPNAAGITCSSDFPLWDEIIAPSTGTLAARAQPDPTATDPCTIPATAGYRRLENQLYRVEVHQGGTDGNATFKWSRDNGSVVTSLVSWVPGSTDQITVASAGRDAATGFAAGQWVELTDDSHELEIIPGTLVQLANVEGTTLTLNTSTAKGPLAQADFPLNPKVRRWDSSPNNPALQTVATGAWINLESGVQVNFGAGTYFSGDYWLIPARTLTSNVDWPVQNGVPAAEPPKGIRRHFCRLALVTLSAAGWSVQQSCMPVFPPLTALGPASAVKAMHVTAVNLISEAGNVAALQNDSNVAVAVVARDAAIEVVCDAPVNPVCAHPAACFVTVEIPRLAPATQGAGTPIGFAPFILACPMTVSSQGNALHFAFDQVIGEFLLQTVKAAGNRLLTRVTLKGSVIWNRDDPTMYLDGEAFGLQRQSYIGLRLPSGGGLRGSDFEMWFWLVAG